MATPRSDSRMSGVMTGWRDGSALEEQQARYRLAQDERIRLDKQRRSRQRSRSATHKARGPAPMKERPHHNPEDTRSAFVRAEGVVDHAMDGNPDQTSSTSGSMKNQAGEGEGEGDIADGSGMDSLARSDAEECVHEQGGEWQLPEVSPADLYYSFSRQPATIFAPVHAPAYVVLCGAV